MWLCENLCRRTNVVQLFEPGLVWVSVRVLQVEFRVKLDVFMLALGYFLDLFDKVFEIFLNVDLLASKQLLFDDLDDEVMAAGVRVSALGPEDLVVLRRDGAVVFGVDEFDVLSIDVVFEAELGNE